MNTSLIYAAPATRSPNHRPRRDRLKLSLCSLAWILLASPPDASPAEQMAADYLPAVRQGNVPLILSVPHGGRKQSPDVLQRIGNGSPQFATVRDENTAELAEKLAAALEQRKVGRVYLISCRVERKFVDVNRPARAAYEADAAKAWYDAYHRALRQACQEVRQKWGRGLLIDLHGQSVRNDSIYFGTEDNRTISALRDRCGAAAIDGPLSLVGQLRSHGYAVVIPDKTAAEESARRFTGGYIVQTYGSHRQAGIDAVQLELGKQWRAKARLDRTAADLAESLAKFTAEYYPREAATPPPDAAPAEPPPGSRR